MATRAQGYEAFPFDICWWFVGGRDQQTGRQVPGVVRLGDAPTGGQRTWDIPVLAFDRNAQEYLGNRENKPGQPVQCVDGSVHEVSFRALDDDADAWMRSGCPPAAQDITMTLSFRDGQRMDGVPQSFYFQLLSAHIDRRNKEPNVILQVNPNDPNSKIELTYLNWDAICKDFIRRRSDLLAVGWWPELLIHERPADPNKPGPMPVEGRSDALGQGVHVATSDQVAQQGPGPAPHPGLDNEGGLI